MSTQESAPAPESEDQIKVKECDERQEEMDAIAGFATRNEFPSVSGAFASAPVSSGSGQGTGGPAAPSVS